MNAYDIKILFLILGISMSLPGCSSSNSSKRESRLGNPAPGTSDLQSAPVPQSQVLYELRAFKMAELPQCEPNNTCTPMATGDLTMEIMSNFSIRFIKGTFEIQKIFTDPLPAPIRIDLTQMLAQFSPEATSMTDNLGTDAEGRIITTRRIGTVMFDPPRPLLLGPIIQNPEDFAGLNRSYPVSFYSTPEAPGTPVSGSTTINLKVINPREIYQPRHASYETAPFETLHWEMTMQQGLGSAPQNMQALLLDRVAFHWRPRPIQIPRLVIETGLAGLIGNQGGGILATIGNLLNGIKVRLVLDAKEVTNF